MQPSTSILAAGLVGLAVFVAAPATAQPKPDAAAPAAPSVPPAPPAAATKPIPPMPPQGMPNPPSIERAFEMLDTDHDAVVTLAEALKGVGEHFDSVDQTKDGALDKAEFDSWFGRANPEAAQFFLALHDLDGDGKVTRAEFENPVKKRFALFDRNDDGKVTPEELGFARMLMTGGPAGMLVPPMSPTGPSEPRARTMPPQYMPPPSMPQGYPQGMPQGPMQSPPQGMPQGQMQGYPQGTPPGQMQQLPQFAPLGMPPSPQSLGPAPGVYGPGGQMWNQPVGPLGSGSGSNYPAGNRPLFNPQPLQLR